MRWLVFAVAVLVNAPCLADKYSDYRDLYNKAKGDRGSTPNPYIARAQERLELIKKGRIDPRQTDSVIDLVAGTAVFTSAAAKEKAKASAEAALAKIQEQAKESQANIFAFYPRMPDKPLEVDMVGVMRGQFTVLQVIDEDSLIVEWWHSPPSRTRQPLWIDGIDTSKIVDGKEVGLPMPMDCVGTKRYTTAIGTQKTIYRLQPVPAEELPKP
jgi:hypothetical protein